jgi:PKD repeat protein
MKYLLFFLLFFLNFCLFSQIAVYQDIFKGGVIAQGGSAGMTLNGTFTFDLTIPEGATIRKVLLVSTSAQNPDSLLISVENNLITWNDASLITSVTHSNLYFTPFKNYLSDITNLIDPFTLNSVNITVKTSCPEQINCGFDAFGLFLIYEKMSLPEICFSLQIPDKDLFGFETYNITNLNPMNNIFPIAFSVYMDRSCDVDFDGTYVNVSGNDLGLIYGSDIQNAEYLCAGTQGNFIYDSLTIVGLQDDVPDLLMQNQDALSDISSILSNNQTNLNILLQHFNINSGPEYKNAYLAFPLAYSTPCQPQNVTVTPDTTICPNTQVQLSATGGTSTGSTPAYEWWPQKDLSCYDCPNPIFSGDSSQLYTVRIWGSDSCSVVRPIMIHVRTKPKTIFYNQSNSLCADSTAFVNWQTAGANTYSLNNGAFQPAGFYNQLPAGEHLLTVRDAFGCTYDTLVLIDDYSSVVANLSVSPLSGEAPLVVQITNQSTEFTDYSWSVNNNIQPNASNSFEAFTAGEYIVQLIAWQNDPTCADTAFQTISVTSAGFYILGSSLVSANSNAQNTFSVLTNGTPIVKVNLYDAQGRLLKTKTNLQLIAGSNTIWSASELSDIASEMVLYRIEWQNGGESGELKGKVLVVR